MSERLRHLRRQQALLREHLAWIETEIALETLAAPAEHQISVTAPPARPAARVDEEPLPKPALVPAAAASLPDPDALLERYASTERQNPADIRRGCFIVFFTALLLVAATVTALWLIFYS